VERKKQNCNQKSFKLVKDKRNFIFLKNTHLALLVLFLRIYL